MTLDEAIAKIVETAATHNDRYYLRHLFCRAPLWKDKSDVEIEHDAAQTLVNRGQANWIPGKNAIHVRPWS